MNFEIKLNGLTLDEICESQDFDHNEKFVLKLYADKEITKLKQENARLREALEFYANGVAVNFDNDDIREQEDSEWSEEHQLYFKGKKARKALEK